MIQTQIQITKIVQHILKLRKTLKYNNLLLNGLDIQKQFLEAYEVHLLHLLLTILCSYVRFINLNFLYKLKSIILLE